MFRSLTDRDLQPEIMDRPDLPADRHQKALRGLARVNVLSRTAGNIWRPIRDLARRNGLRELSLLDVASGGGDVACDLHRLAAADGIRLRVTGYDISPVAVEAAARRAAEVGADARFEIHDVFTSPPEPAFDVVTSSLFLHHLTEPQAVEVLSWMRQSCRRMLVVSDLLRTWLGYTTAKIVVKLVTRSEVVHYDGPQSVAGAFRMDEARRLAEAAGLTDAELRKIWPFRFLLTWKVAS